MPQLGGPFSGQGPETRCTLADGGLPFVAPMSTHAGVAPWFAGGDPAVSSLQITAFTTAAAHRVAAHDPAVARHPWLRRATS
jgi:hypothetical protein